MKKISLISIIFITALLESNAQPKIELWSQKFDAYKKTMPEVNLHLVFNQCKYSPGDTVWFKAYFVNEDVVGVPGKQLINLDLVDSRGKSRLHLLSQVKDGHGQNQFVIPDSLSSGIYLVTAYSNWMRNFDPVFMFKKEIEIVSENTVEKMTDGIRLSAEGGVLTAGVPGKVCARTNNSNDVVQIFDSRGNEIARANTNCFGVASVIVTPGKDVSYVARILGASEAYPLPKVEGDGCSLMLDALAGQGESTRLFVRMPQYSKFLSEELTIVVSARGKIHFTKTFTQHDERPLSLEVLNDELPAGIIHASLLSKEGVLLSSRDFYNAVNDITNVKIKIGDQPIHPREKVKLEVVMTDESGNPVQGEYSIAVLNTTLSNDEKAIECHTLKYSVGDDSFLIDDNQLRDYNDYLITETHPVRWEEILAGKIPAPRYKFETAIQRIGTAYGGETVEPVPDLTRIMFYLQDAEDRYEIISSGGGKFLLTMSELYGQDELFYLARTNEKDIRDLKIVWDKDSIKFPKAPISTESSTPDRYAAFALKQKLIAQSYGLFSKESQSDYVNKKMNIERNVVDADVSINVQDYVDFSTMGELIKEVVPALYTRKRGEKNIVRVKYLPTETESGDPVYIIDGIATMNTDFFLSLQPKDILTVKVIHSDGKLGSFGLMGKNGIVVVQTKMGNLREPLRDSSRIIQGISKPLAFHVPNYSGSDFANRPDFKSTIYWNPSLKTNSAGKALVEFYPSDDVGKFTVRIEGLTKGGVPFVVNKSLEVLLPEIAD